MPESMNTSRWIYIRWFIIRFLLVVFDIAAINISHYLALVIRFYVASEFHSVAGQYIEAYNQYALWYTVSCLVIFSFLKLYSGIWKFAGFNDLNRIVFASIFCFVAHVCGTLLFAMRMPITFYCIGSALQFCLITASRFSYRLFLIEKGKVLGNKDAQIRAMIIGTGGTAKTVRRELERESNIRLMCVLNYKKTNAGSLFDGIPVVNGINQLKTAIEKYQINYVILASASMPQEIRGQLKALCSEIQVEAQDYSGFFQTAGSHITFRNLSELVTGPVELIIHESHHRFTDGRQALQNILGRYIVRSVWAEGDALMIELDEYAIEQNDLNADWVKSQEEETGEAISFF